MANKPVKLPAWNTGGANNTEPSGAKKILGYIPDEDNVSSSFLNWLMKLYYDWLSWLNDRTNDVGVAPRIGLRGIETTAEDANGNGTNSTGLGTGNGVSGTGGATSGEGVRGTGGAPNGPGVHGVGTGSGSGVVGEASGTGYGVVAQADTSAPARAALRVVPQDTAPTTPLEGDIYQNSTTHKFYVYNGTAWVPLQLPVVGNVVGSAFDQNSDVQTWAAAKIPRDGTIPQNTEGSEVHTLAYTATKVGNRLRIRAVGFFSHNAAAGAVIALAGFKDAVADAICAFGTHAPQFGMVQVECEWEEVVADLLPHTFKFRVGADTNATDVYENFDGTAGHWYDGSLFGGGQPPGGFIEITEFTT